MNSEPLKRITLAAAVVVLLVIVTSPVTTIWLIKRQATVIVSDSLRGLTTSSLATMHMSEGFLDTALAVNGSEEQGKALGRQLIETTRLVDAEYDAHRETLRTDKERAAFGLMIERRRDYLKSRGAVIKSLDAGKTEEARKLFEGECVVKFESYAKALGDVVEHNASEARDRGREIIRLCYILLGIQVLLLVFFFVYGFFVPMTAFVERLNRKSVVFQD
jgi:hypothetical protein